MSAQKTVNACIYSREQTTPGTVVRDSFHMRWIMLRCETGRSHTQTETRNWLFVATHAYPLSCRNKYPRPKSASNTIIVNDKIIRWRFCPSLRSSTYRLKQTTHKRPEHKVGRSHSLWQARGDGFSAGRKHGGRCRLLHDAAQRMEERCTFTAGNSVVTCETGWTGSVRRGLRRRAWHWTMNHEHYILFSVVSPPPSFWKPTVTFAFLTFPLLPHKWIFMQMRFYRLILTWSRADRNVSLWLLESKASVILGQK